MDIEKIFLLENRCKLCNKVSPKMFCESCIEKLFQDYVFTEFLKVKNTNFLKVFLREEAKDFVDVVVSVVEYRGEIEDILHRYKFLQMKEYEILIKELLYNFFRKYPDILEELTKGVDIITYVPMSLRRLLERRYNPAKQIAKILHSLVYPKNVVLLKLLNRKGWHKPQSSTKNYLERYENVKNKFSVTKKDLIKNKNILVVDDVITTGSTIVEIARVLKENGARKINVFTFAKSKIL